MLVLSLNAPPKTTKLDVYVSLGSNIDREKNLSRALGLLKAHFDPVVCSSVYESEAVGFVGAPFLNLVIGFETTCELIEVSRTLKSIENRCGRRRDGPRYSPRTLDLDLLLFGGLVVRENGLCLPRDEITLYAFVLKPLAEVAGDKVHPTLGKSFSELWREFDDKASSLVNVNLDLSSYSGDATGRGHETL